MGRQGRSQSGCGLGKQSEIRASYEHRIGSVGVFLPVLLQEGARICCKPNALAPFFCVLTHHMA
jgi:hypothetical protein